MLLWLSWPDSPNIFSKIERKKFVVNVSDGDDGDDHGDDDDQVKVLNAYLCQQVRFTIMFKFPSYMSYLCGKVKMFSKIRK